jgi:hypothetical protein
MKNNKSVSENKTAFQYLCVSELKCAYTYNRPIKKKHVQEIVANYNPNLMLPLVVSKRKDGYYIIDGQHRCMALKTLGITTVLCLIHFGLTEQQEADLFNRLDSGSKRLTTIERFNAAVLSSDGKACDVMRIISESGLIAPNNGATAPNKIIAIGELLRIYDEVGPVKLARTLSLIHQTWNGSKFSLSKQILMGMSHFVKLYDKDFINKDFADKFHQIDPVKIINAGKSNEMFSAGSSVSYAIAIWKMYNYNRKTKILKNKFDLSER